MNIQYTESYILVYPARASPVLLVFCSLRERSGQQLNIALAEELQKIFMLLSVNKGSASWVKTKYSVKSWNNFMKNHFVQSVHVEVWGPQMAVFKQ